MKRYQPLLRNYPSYQVLFIILTQYILLYSTMPRAKFINDDITLSAFDISKMALSDSAKADTRFEGITGEVEEFTLFRTDTSNGQQYKDIRHIDADVNFDANREVVLRGDSERPMPKKLIITN